MLCLCVYTVYVVDGLILSLYVVLTLMFYCIWFFIFISNRVPPIIPFFPISSLFFSTVSSLSLLSPSPSFFLTPPPPSFSPLLFARRLSARFYPLPFFPTLRRLLNSTIFFATPLPRSRGHFLFVLLSLIVRRSPLLRLP